MQSTPTKAGTAIDGVRYEPFGGIVSCLNPPFLAWVDKDFMRRLGYESSPLWESGQTYLSAPTEVHFAVTNRCSQQCEGCYMSSGPGEQELGTDELKACLDMLSRMGVFHVALGGGEAFERDDFAEIVTHCRRVGIVPNLTTNGQNIGAREAQICRQMGQVNVSVDGVGERYAVNGRAGSFERVDRAIDTLKRTGVPVGVNCVVSRRNFDHLPDLIAWAAGRGLNEIEFLKYKPSGRGAAHYDEHALTQEMIRSLYPTLMEQARRWSTELKVDCSFVPALCYHRPPREDLEKLAVTGCDGGNLLLGVRSNGTFCACSFVTNNEPVAEIEQRWHTSAHLQQFRALVERAEEPCRSCEYLGVCRCGCRAVALYRTGRFFAPDPECPFVHEYHRGETR